MENQTAKFPSFVSSGKTFFESPAKKYLKDFQRLGSQYFVIVRLL